MLVWSNPRHANDLGAAAFMQFVKDAIVSCDDLLKHLRRNGNFESAVRRFDKNHLAANFNVRRCFGKITVHLPLHLLPMYPEQLGKGPKPKVNFNRSLRLIARLLPTGSNPRRTVVTCPTLGQAA